MQEIYKHPWYTQQHLPGNTTTSESESTPKPSKEATGQKSTKYCPKCDQVLPRESFSKATYSTDGLQPWCKNCYKDYQKGIRECRKTAPPVPENCQCCGATLGDKPHMDHDHETGEFRGWLCNKCNVGLGGMNDSISGLFKGLKYIIKSHLPTQEE